MPSPTFRELIANLKDLISNTQWEGQVYAAGGCVRDMVMGRQSKDIDLVVTAPDGGIDFANWMYETVPGVSAPVIFPRFGTAKFDYRDWDIEVVMPRSEVYADETRNPDVQYTTLADDAKRRDFTINALYLNLSTGDVLDFVGGEKDIAQRLIRTAMDPALIFTDDPLRMLRAIRFARRFDFRIDSELTRAMERCASQLTRISQERITTELNGILVTDQASTGLEQMRLFGLLPYVLPEAVAMVGCTQNKYHFGDVWRHTLWALDKTAPVLETRLGALFHDIAKPVVKSTMPTGDVHFYKHEDVGATMTEEILRRMKYPNHVIEAVVKIVREHMRLKDSGPQGQYISDKALRKFRTAMGQHLNLVLDVMHADNCSHSEPYCLPEQIPGIQTRLEQLANAEPKKVTLPINGHDVMTVLNIPAGPEIGRLLKVVEEAWYDNPSLTREEALALVKQTVA